MNRSNSHIPGWLAFALSVAFVFSSIAVIIFAYLTFQVVIQRPLNPMEGIEVADVDLALEQEGPALAPVLGLGIPTPTLVPTSEPWGGTDRVNLLLMGIDRRPGEAFISRTDSMMIVSVDPVTESISILSVPRDLYVDIPGRGRDRINTAFVYGSGGDNPEGGASLAMQTVAYNLGVPLDHYVMVDFSAVTKGIDLLGGIDVYVPQDLSDPTYPDMDYGFDPLYIPAGTQHLDGELALKYARTRHADNDFGRASRQQQVMLAARNKAISMGVGSLLTKAPAIYRQLENGVKTDLSLDQLIALATTISEIPEENIRNEVLGYGYVSSYRAENGAQVLVLDNAAAAQLIQELFYNNE
ncbi:MAG: LCP family protein [Anaerolineae bacterium]|nr:LCP family protein [Anaerolineae bacterium]